MSLPAPKSNIVVHHLADSRSQRILWLLEELAVPYEVKKYERTQQRRAPKDLYDVHSLGKSPVITDGDLTIAESGAIIEYILETYGTAKNKVKVGTAAWRDNLYFTHYAEGSVQPLLVRKFMFTMIPDNAPAIMQPVLYAVFSKLNSKLTDPELALHASLIETHLQKVKDTSGNNGWFAGGYEPTSADFMMGYTLEVFMHRSPEHVGPRTREYVKRLQSRPAYQRAVEQGGQTVKNSM